MIDEQLQESAVTARVSYFYAFDLLAVDGEDLQEWPLAERKRRLRRLIPSVPTRLLYVDHVEARGRDFFQVACAHDLEGIGGSSRAAATYAEHVALVAG